MKKETKILSILIFVAFVIRVLVLWIGRPEFVGWFNHTYYYYVETKGILQNGELPFPDMPLLFYIYAGTSKFLTLMGIEMNTAIVMSTRLWMSIIPSILPIPIYLTIKNIYKEEPLPKWIWIFLFVCPFYPFSILQMPEFLQKNVLGILLLSFFIWQSNIALNKSNLKRLVILVALFLLIVLTHYGTAATTILYVASITITFFMQNSKKVNFKLILGLFSGLSIALTAFYFIDLQRFNRVRYYIDRIYDSSSLGLLFSSGESDKSTAVFILIIPLLIVVFLFKCYKSVRIKLSNENNSFWLTNIIFCYLLILPIYDLELMGRFAIYLGLPVLFVLIYMIRYYLKKTWLKKLILGFLIFGTLIIGFGDIVKGYWDNQNNDIISEDLMKMKDTVGFTKNDLIIARNGVEHISNWFLNTKSCIITSFNTADFHKYNRVFILNPTEGRMSMLSNIHVPSNAIDIYVSEHIELYEIESQPTEWVFNDKGDWINYKKK